MVRVALHVGHPGNSSTRFEMTLPALPRVGDFIRADEAMLLKAGAHSEAELWSVLAVVHEPPTETIEATLHVVPADMRDIFDIFEDKPTS
jgi:hypothetical protein